MVATTGLRNKRSMGPGAIPLSKTVGSMSGVYGSGHSGDSRWSGESLVPSDGYSGLVRVVKARLPMIWLTIKSVLLWALARACVTCFAQDGM